MARRHDLALPTERTPLLAGSSRTTTARHGSSTSRGSPIDPGLPHVGSFVAEMRPEELRKYTVDSLCPPTLQSRSAQTAFALCALLYYGTYLREATTSRRDIWAQWRQQELSTAALKAVEALLDQVWDRFLEEEGLPEDVQEVLWAAYPLYPDSPKTVRVLDFLVSRDAPQRLLSHRLVQLCLEDTWIYGRHGSPGNDDLWTRSLHFWDSTGVPHGYIALYAFSRIFRSWSSSTPPFLLTLLSFILAFPSTPLPDSSAYTLLLIAFSWKIVLLHLPVHPSPLFLLYPEQTLPLAVLVWRGLGQTFIPVVAFFIPGLLIALALLSIALSNKFLWLTTAYSTSASPMDSRVVFLSLFTLIFLFLVCALGYVVLINPFLAPTEGPSAVSWDRFSKSVGMEARQSFARTVDTYARPYYFPAPFNILQVLLVQLPQTVFRRSHLDAFQHTGRLEKVLWRIIIAPGCSQEMSSRKRSGRGGGQPPTKRRRTEIGGHKPDDDIPTPQAQANAPSASALSTRTLPPKHPPTLATTCVRVFADNFRVLSGSEEESTREDVRWWLKQLPDSLSQRVFAGLRHTCPTWLNHGLIVAYFLRGSNIVLSDDLPGVGKLTIFAIGDMQTKDKLRELQLTGFGKIADNVFASVIAKLPSLRKLNLRGCTKVGQKTAEAIAEHCALLEVVNLNYTSVAPMSLAPLLLKCQHLEVLKVAGIPNWTDTTCSKLWSALDATEDFKLPNLRSLKLRQAPLSDAVVNPILAACPNLQRLDLSFTAVKRPSLPPTNLMEKLVLTSTKIASGELVSIVRDLPLLKTLALGAMGGGQGSSAAISNTSAMTMTDEFLHALTEILEGCPNLERVNLVGNTKLGFSGRRGPDAALAYFIRRVGRRCKYLNLAGITSLRSSDLEGLADPDGVDEGPPQLVQLNLNNTAVDDTAAPYISTCIHLQTLELAGTKFSSAGLFPIIDACERLENLDLTSCRGVRVSDRRRFFEVWEEEWKNR
ncbi:RNI-like protein [Lentinus tigrinus ALCF2SS1-7]|uniref:RNI-like protein n=1 Tax=Lentinus tigrinus ALCF2SS1-7 TaxID=1328758 RepID=UPI001165EEFF|nr:RNI-like protein [Lentinus tigrinus ALCF2SS1-7]